MNIDTAHMQYASARSDEQRTHLTKNECFDCDQKKHCYKNCSTNSYNKIQQMMIINLNESVSTRKTYAMFMTSLKTSEKRTHFTSFHVITSHIMFLNELKNKLF